MYGLSYNPGYTREQEQGPFQAALLASGVAGWRAEILLKGVEAASVRRFYVDWWGRSHEMDFTLSSCFPPDKSGVVQVRISWQKICNFSGVAGATEGTRTKFIVKCNNILIQLKK